MEYKKDIVDEKKNMFLKIKTVVSALSFYYTVAPQLFPLTTTLS